MVKDPITVLSFFDGISCGQLALSRVGIPVGKYFASEIDKSAMGITQSNFPNTIQLGDVEEIDLDSLPKIDLFIAGSPCQGFSASGKGLNFDDPRSRLYFTFEKALEKLSPKYFLLENVKMKNEEWENIITNRLGVSPIEIDSALVSAQTRKRLYWTNIPNITQPEDKGIVLRDIVDYNDPNPKWYDEKNLNYPRFGRTYFAWDVNGLGHRSQSFRAYYLHGKHRTVTATTSGEKVYVDEKRVKVLSPLEIERLQTLPDNYTASEKSRQKRIHAIGNGWTVDVIAHILSFME